MGDERSRVGYHDAAKFVLVLGLKYHEYPSHNAQRDEWIVDHACAYLVGIAWMDEMNGSEKTQNDDKPVIDELMKGDLGVIEQFLIIDDSRKVVGKCLKIVCIGEIAGYKPVGSYNSYQRS